MYKRGFTFLEIMLALSILSVALVGFLEIFNTALNSSYRATQESIAINLARGLMAEIMGKNFEEPGSGTPPPALGLDAGEIITDRNTFDDVDDYNDYSESPPLTVGGDPMDGLGTPPRPNYSRFSRGVSVVYCDISGSNIVDVVAPTDYKHITVSVSGPYVKNISLNEIKAK